MGITGLLKSLETISNKKHLSDYKGKRIAVDGYCWLHKAIYMIKSEVIENPNSTKYNIE
jgi:exonuclease-1